MNGLRLSQENMAHDEILPEEIQRIEMLLNTKTPNAEVVLSDGELELVRILFEKVAGPSQQVNHELLRRVLKSLQVWVFSPVLGKLLEIGIVRNLARIYDNLIQTDYSRSEVLSSILELLFVVEDISDSCTEGKIQSGKFFLFRLLALANDTVKSPCVKLQRAAIETVCAVITRSAENQQAVLDKEDECYKLFQVFLPRCGDFQMQGSIIEIFYRLGKRGPQLLQFIQDKVVRKSIESLMQSKQPDLLLEIRTIVTLFNESLGHLRSVYSFRAERILIDGHKINMADKWVNFGRTQLSFFIVRLGEPNVDESPIMDMQYENIVEIKRSSSTLLEILVRDKSWLSACKVRDNVFASVRDSLIQELRAQTYIIINMVQRKALGLGTDPSIPVHTQIYFTPEDLSTIGASLLRKISAHSIGRQGTMESSDLSTYKSTRKVSTGDPVRLKTVQPRNTKSVTSNEGSPGGPRLPERTERRAQNEKSSFDYIHTSPDFVSQSLQVPDTHEGAAVASDRRLKMDEARLERNQTLPGMTTHGPKSSKPPGKHAQDCHQPRVASVSSTFERFNPLSPSRQPFSHSQEDHQLQNRETEPADGNRNMSLKPAIGSQADINQSQKVIVATRDGNENCEKRRISKPSHLQIQNLQPALSGPKTKSPAEANLRAQVAKTDDETPDSTEDSERRSELRMKKRHDPQHTTVVPLEPPGHIGKTKMVRNICHQMNTAELQEAERCSESSEKNLMTPPRDMLAPDSVMTDIREKLDTSGKGTKSCHARSSRAVLNSATRRGEDGETNASRALRKRTCKKTTRYFDADDELTSSSSDSSMEFVVTRQKKSSGTVTDPFINKSAKHRNQTTTKCERGAAAQEKNRGLTACQRNSPTPDKHPCGQKAPTISVNRKENYSTKRKANLERKVGYASNSKVAAVDDVFCFTATPTEERQPWKTSSSLTCKARRNSDYAEPNRKKTKRPAELSHKVLSVARQRSCASDGPRSNIPVRSPKQVMESPPRDSPGGSTPRPDEVTPQQREPGNAGISSHWDSHPKFPLRPARKTYTTSDIIVTKHSRLERWKSVSIRKLELPTVDDTSNDESSDEATQRSCPARVIEDVAADSEDSSGIGMVANLLNSFKQKVKLVEKKTVGDIVSNTMQRIQREIQLAEEQVRGEKTVFMDDCNKKWGQLDHDLQGQIKKMRAMYDKFQLDFAQHLERHDMIVGEIEETKVQLNDLAKQQGQDHKDILAKLKESCKQLIADADQKILEVGQNSAGMRGLKEALQGILKDL